MKELPQQDWLDQLKEIASNCLGVTNLEANHKLLVALVDAYEFGLIVGFGLARETPTHETPPSK